MKLKEIITEELFVKDNFGNKSYAGSKKDNTYTILGHNE